MNSKNPVTQNRLSRIVPQDENEPVILDSKVRDVRETYEAHIGLKIDNYPLLAAAWHFWIEHQMWILSLTFVAVMGLLLLSFGRKTLDQRQAMAQWNAIPSPVRGEADPLQSLSDDYRMHTPSFWRVMKVFKLKEGDPAELFIEVLGQPEKVEPVRWYYYPKQAGDNPGTEQFYWRVAPVDAFVLGGYIRTFDAQCYTWKYDRYYWPRP